MLLSRWIEDPQVPVQVRQQPRRADQQELHVPEERWLLALDPVADELSDPGGNEDANQRDPEREGQSQFELTDRNHNSPSTLNRMAGTQIQWMVLLLVWRWLSLYLSSHCCMVRIVLPSGTLPKH
jgi:hypothetical protein